MKIRPTYIILVFSLFLSSIALAQEKVGHVVEKMGKVLVAHEGEKSADLELQSEIFLKDVIETKKDGITKIHFKDGTDLILRENTKILVSEFLFQPKKGQRESIFEIMKGKVRATISKTFNLKSSKTELKTPTAVVGVRGTELALDVSRTQTRIYCLKGRIEAFGKAFPMRAISVLAGTSTNVAEGALPEPPLPITRDILDAIESQFNIPTSLDSVKERGLDKIRGRLPSVPGF